MKLKLPLLLLITLIVGCSAFQTSPTSVIAAACSPSEYQIERCASGVSEVYAAYQAQVLTILKDPSTPVEVRKALKKVDATLTPQVSALNQATLNFVAIKSAPEATPQEIETARTALNRSLKEVRPQVEAESVK